MIGVVVPNLVTHYYAAVLDGIEDEARRAGYSVISANSHESFEAETHAVDNFVSLHVEGIIACLAQNTTDYHHYEEIADMGIPLVFFGRTCLTDQFSSVTANGDEAAQMATQHLIDTGSRRIAFKMNSLETAASIECIFVYARHTGWNGNRLQTAAKAKCLCAYSRQTRRQRNRFE